MSTRVFVPQNPPGSRNWNVTDSAVTPRLGVIYDLTDTVAVYANTARSFKPNSGASREGGGFKPEEGKSYEMGVKWEALDRQLSVDAAVYQIEKNVTCSPLTRWTPPSAWPPAKCAAVVST
nr:hypothetical protein GCM10020185_70980 [Pseudomonas brassicacearum subsp. brassicacearum]